MANEKRLDLIDRNVLKPLFDVRYDTAFIQERTRENKEQWSGYCTGINWGRNTIADAPTVDAVEVVRCKDCIHNRKAIDEKGHGIFCSIWGRSWHRVEPDDFCSYGERREGE